MKRSDDVFFFTLIDFLLQVFFFGLLLFVVFQSLNDAQDKNREQEIRDKDELLKTVGVSSIAELSDLLTKMVPLDHLRGTSDFIARHGGQQGVEAALNAVGTAGGAEKVVLLASQVKALNEKVAKLEGWGKVSCIPNITINGVIRPKSIATVVVSDSVLTLQDPTPEMESLLRNLGLQFQAVKQLSLVEFRKQFAPIIDRQPECRYFLNVVTKTEYLEPMRAVWSVFRTQ